MDGEPVDGGVVKRGNGERCADVGGEHEAGRGVERDLAFDARVGEREHAFEVFGNARPCALAFSGVVGAHGLAADLAHEAFGLEEAFVVNAVTWLLQPHGLGPGVGKFVVRGSCAHEVAQRHLVRG